jgi:hypothetical protein
MADMNWHGVKKLKREALKRVDHFRALRFTLHVSTLQRFTE